MLRLANRLLISSMLFYLYSSLILVRWSSIPSPFIKTSHSVVVHSFLDSSSLDYYRILALRLLLHKRSRWLMPCWMRAFRPNTIVTCMVPWLLQFQMALKMLHRISKLIRRHLSKRARFDLWSRMHSFLRLHQGLAPVKDVPNHLKLHMAHRLLYPRFLKKWCRPSILSP